VQNDNSLQDEEVIPILRAAGLDAKTAKAACLRLLGGQLTVRTPAECATPNPEPAVAVQMSCYQFAAGMFEEEITGEQFPMALLNLAMAFSNVDFDDALCALLTRRHAAGSYSGFASCRTQRDHGRQAPHHLPQDRRPLHAAR